MIIGESQLEGVGFGLYIIEDVKKGEFLSEYAGEVAPGTCLRPQSNIFSFDLNENYVLDNAKFGNKTRFINHASHKTDGLNYAAKVTFVNGEHRIKFVALRDIKAGEELFFNYGRKFAEKHGLSRKLTQAKDVAQDKDGFNTLDGVTARKRIKRAKKARAGSGGRQTAKTKEPDS